MSITHRIFLKDLLPPSPVTCEVGVASGLFSRDICEKWRPSLHYAVDKWEYIPDVTGDGNFPQNWHDNNLRQAKANLKEFTDVVVWLRGTSWEKADIIPDKFLDIVYLDAAHYYEAVKKDLEAYYPKVKEGGIIAGHDVSNEAYGVEQAVREFTSKMCIEFHIIPENNPADASFYFIKPFSKC